VLSFARLRQNRDVTELCASDENLQQDDDQAPVSKLCASDENLQQDDDQAPVSIKNCLDRE